MASCENLIFYGFIIFPCKRKRLSKTKIAWATDVWNPVTGYTKISEGCRSSRVPFLYKGKNPPEDLDLHEAPEISPCAGRL